MYQQNTKKIFKTLHNCSILPHDIKNAVAKIINAVHDGKIGRNTVAPSSIHVQYNALPLILTGCIFNGMVQ